MDPASPGTAYRLVYTKPASHLESTEIEGYTPVSALVAAKFTSSILGGGGTMPQIMNPQHIRRRPANVQPQSSVRHPESKSLMKPVATAIFLLAVTLLAPQRLQIGRASR